MQHDAGGGDGDTVLVGDGHGRSGSGLGRSHADEGEREEESTHAVSHILLSDAEGAGLVLRVCRVSVPFVESFLSNACQPKQCGFSLQLRPDRLLHENFS